MKIQFTFLTLKKIKVIAMTACLSLLFSPQLFAQHHKQHGGGNDSTYVWNDSNHIWTDTIHFPPPPPPPPHDSGRVWHDTIHFPHDSGYVWHDTIHFPPPPPPHDSGHVWHDTIHFPPPPPPQDSGHVWNDSGHAGCDTNHFPPPPPQDSGYAGNDSGHCPPPPPHHGGGRYADSVNPSGSVSASIYPNPVVESAVLHIENTSGNVTFRMYGINGNLVMEKELTNGDFQLDKTNLGAGVYFYEINDGNTSVSKGKLIFQ